MKGSELLNNMELVDPAFVEEAAMAPKKKKIWVRWFAAAAACICLIAGAFAAEHFSTAADYPAADSIAQVSSGFTLEGSDDLWYFPISFDERVRYELVPEGTEGLTAENTYKITKSDLGEKMSTVSNCGDEELIGADVYHFAKFPSYDSICIVDTPNGYAFYTAGYFMPPDHIGYTSDEALAAYGLPTSAESIRILSPDGQPLGTVENTEDTAAIFEILSGKVNSGLEANERRFADAWYEATGNDDFFFNEETGYCEYRDLAVSEDVTDFIISGERLIEITTDKGFQITIDFFPCIRTFIFVNGYYELSVEESASLSMILEK